MRSNFTSHRPGPVTAISHLAEHNHYNDTLRSANKDLEDATGALNDSTDEESQHRGQNAALIAKHRSSTVLKALNIKV